MTPVSKSIIRNPLVHDDDDDGVLSIINLMMYSLFTVLRILMFIYSTVNIELTVIGYSIINKLLFLL
jgi:hypothetical protein